MSGCGDEECFFILGSAESYDPNTGAWSNTGGLNAPRYNVSATTMLPNGNVLVAAGSYWNATASLNTARYDHTATLLPDGKVLVGGYGKGVGEASGYLRSDELYDPEMLDPAPTVPRIIMASEAA